MISSFPDTYINMKKLLSLPPNLVNSFHKIAKVNVDEWFCTSDPVGARLGSGGGTTWLIEACRQNEAPQISVKEWLAKCEERRKHPVFPFASDLPETDRMDDHAALPDGVVPVDRIKKAIYWIHEAGGCDATGKYGQGYDDAIVVVVNFLLDEFGLTFEEIEDYHDGQEQGLKKTYHKDNPAGSCREKRGKNMECKECVYFWQEEAEVRSSCKWVQRAPGEVALCDEEEQPYESTEWD